MEANKYIFSIDMKVRDYECDLQGVVNNANYMHYMEHTRHEFWQSLGANFSQMHDDGLDVFVYKTTIIYKKSLRSGDTFTSALSLRMKGAKLIFHQDIINSLGEISCSAQVEVVTVKDGQLTRGEYFRELLVEYI